MNGLDNLKKYNMTAVEWLELNLLGLISFDSEELRAKYKDRVAKAKEMEKQQQGYGEEEVIKILYQFHYDLVNSNFDTKEEWFQKFKKK